MANYLNEDGKLDFSKIILKSKSGKFFYYVAGDKTRVQNIPEERFRMLFVLAAKTENEKLFSYLYEQLDDNDETTFTIMLYDNTQWVFPI